jgi:hypothetical protein
VPALRLCAARETLFGRTPAVEFEAVCLESCVLRGLCACFEAVCLESFVFWKAMCRRQNEDYAKAMCRERDSI